MNGQIEFEEIFDFEVVKFSLRLATSVFVKSLSSDGLIIWIASYPIVGLKHQGRYSSINNLDITYSKKQKISRSIYTRLLIFIIGIAPLVSGYGAICYGIKSFVDADINTIVVNNNIRVFGNIFIIICGMITILQGIIISMILQFILLFV